MLTVHVWFIKQNTPSQHFKCDSLEYTQTQLILTESYGWFLQKQKKTFFARNEIAMIQVEVI